MTMVPLNQLTKEAHSDFQILFQKTMSKAQDYNKKYSRDDARREFFMTFGQLNSWILIQFDDFLETLDRQNTKIKKYLNLTENDRTTYLLQFDNINRSAYLTECMFNMEHFLHAVLNKLDQSIPNGYGGKLTKFLKSLDRYNDNNYKILNLPAQIRNSLHQDGHTKYEIDVTIKGNLFRSSAGSQVKFSGWNNLYIILNEMADLLIDIIENSKINELDHIPKLHFIFKES